MSPEEAISFLSSSEVDFWIGIYDYVSSGNLASAIEMAIRALRKQIPEKPEFISIKHGKHTWHRNDQGEIDEYAFEEGYHSGVMCDVCGKTVCIYCEDDYEEKYWKCPSRGRKINYGCGACSCGKLIDWSEGDTDAKNDD